MPSFHRTPRCSLVQLYQRFSSLALQICSFFLPFFVSDKSPFRLPLGRLSLLLHRPLDPVPFLSDLWWLFAGTVVSPFVMYAFFLPPGRLCASTVVVTSSNRVGTEAGVEDEHWELLTLHLSSFHFFLNSTLTRDKRRTDTSDFFFSFLLDERPQEDYWTRYCGSRRFVSPLYLLTDPFMNIYLFRSPLLTKPISFASSSLR